MAFKSFDWVYLMKVIPEIRSATKLDDYIFITITGMVY